MFLDKDTLKITTLFQNLLDEDFNKDHSLSINLLTCIPVLYSFYFLVSLSLFRYAAVLHVLARTKMYLCIVALSYSSTVVFGFSLYLEIKSAQFCKGVVSVF